MENTVEVMGKRDLSQWHAKTHDDQTAVLPAASGSNRLTLPNRVDQHNLIIRSLMHDEQSDEHAQKYDGDKRLEEGLTVDVSGCC